MSPRNFPTAQDAENAFYEALERADVEAMMEVWAEDDDIVCVHPAGPRLAGQDQVRAGWVAALAGAPGPHSTFVIGDTPLDVAAALANGVAAVGVAALKYADLSTDRVKDYLFSFDRMLAFSQILPVLRERVERDLSLPGLPRRKILATTVRLLEKTGGKSGNWTARARRGGKT